MASLYEFVKSFFVTEVFGPNMTENEITRHHILILHKEINRTALDNFDAYHLQYWRNEDCRNEIEAGFRSGYFIDILRNPLKPSTDTKFIPRPDTIERLYDPNPHGRHPFSDKFNDAFALSVAACGYRDYCNDTIQNQIRHNKNVKDDLFVRSHSIPKLISIEKEINALSNKLPEWITLSNRSQLNNILLELNSRTYLDFDEIVHKIIQDKKMDAVSHYQLISATNKEVSHFRRKTLIVMCSWILTLKFDERVYDVLKKQMTFHYNEEIIQMIILSLCTLVLTYKHNSIILGLIKDDLDKIYPLLSLQSDNNIEKPADNIPIEKINDTYYENPQVIEKFISKEVIILCLKGLIDRSKIKTTTVKYQSALNAELHKLINNYKRHFEDFYDFQVVLPMRRITFDLGNRDLTIKSKHESESNPPSNKRYEIVKQKQGKRNFLGIPLLIDESVKKELDSLFYLEGISSVGGS